VPGERANDRGGPTSRAEVPGVQLQQQPGTEAAHCAKGPVALQAKNSGTDTTDTRDQSGTNAAGTYGLLLSDHTCRKPFGLRTVIEIVRTESQTFRIYYARSA